jgi:hypothetical protein
MTAVPGVASSELLVTPVRYAGDKTFVLHDGVWVDTTFDPDQMETRPLGFASDDYFALAATRPEWGPYLALGDHVIVVLDGTAYEIREGTAPALEFPSEEGAQPAASVEVQAQTPSEDVPSNWLTKVMQAMLGLFETLVDALFR